MARGWTATASPSCRRLTIDTIRGLSMDAVQKAGAGHPGTAMALAPLGYVLFKRVLRVNPRNPRWQDRDRFVLSAGHACVLLYSLLHLSGYELSLEDLTQFRQWGSRTPGHPERGHTPGVEVTTGPLGQGFANAVGMAMSERFLAERYNRPGEEVVDHHTYVICSDGDMMEGISQEAASIAGHFGLGRLTVCYDDNRITIDGSTAISFDGENHIARLAADGWHVQRVGDSEDIEALTVRARGRARGNRAPVVHRGALAHRLPRPPRGGHRGRARRAAGRGGGARGEARDGLRPGARLLGGRAGVRAHEPRGRRRGGRARVAVAVGCVARGAPRAGAGLGARLGGSHGGWLARGAAELRGGREAGHARGRAEDDGGLLRIRPHDGGRRGRPRRVDQDGVPRRRPVLQGAHGPQRAVRDPRARDGGDRQRRGGARGDRQAVRLDVPDLLRLHARRRCASPR